MFEDISIGDKFIYEDSQGFLTEMEVIKVTKTTFTGKSQKGLTQIFLKNGGRVYGQSNSYFMQRAKPYNEVQLKEDKKRRLQMHYAIKLSHINWYSYDAEVLKNIFDIVEENRK